MTGPISAPRYSAEDFETASIRSTAPSYLSNTPSYHSTAQYSDSTPAYTPVAPRLGRSAILEPRRQNLGLPPIPPVSSQNSPNLHSFNLPTWSTANAPAARHYRKVAERRVIDGRNRILDQPSRHNVVSVQDQSTVRQGGRINTDARPLEDPYLVGEQAAAEARRERLSRETGEDLLQREDRQWDWLLTQMRTWDERERTWARHHRDVDHGQRKKLRRRIGLGLL